jgi:putative ABC transport system substrate-binding protein
VCGIRPGLLAFGLLIAITGLQPATAPAQSNEGPFRVGILLTQEASPYDSVGKGFKTELKNLGVAAQYRTYRLDPRGKLGPGLRDGGWPQLVLAMGPSATAAGLERLKTTPIVAALVRRRIEVSEARNATGVLFDYPVEAQMEWMNRLMPGHKRVGVLFNPSENDERVNAAARVAGKYGLDLLPQEVHRPKDLPKALRELASNADLLWGIADQTVINPATAKQFIVFSFENRIPLSGYSTSWVKAGALFSLERDYVDIGGQCAALALQIRGGASPGALAPESPRRLLYSVNLKTARHMRLRIPEDVVQNAAYAFE